MEKICQIEWVVDSKNFSGFKPAVAQTPISKSYGWLDAFLQRVNEQVQQYNTHFNSHETSAGRRFRLLDAIKKKSGMIPQIGSSQDYFENIRTFGGVLGDLIFLDWVDEEQPVVEEEGSSSRVISGWGSSSAENQFMPAHVVASPWLNTPFTPARVASKSPDQNKREEQVPEKFQQEKSFCKKTQRKSKLYSVQRRKNIIC